MLQQIDVEELAEWKVYSELEPFDETRADARSAQVVAAVWNAIGRRKGKAMTIADAMLKFSEAPSSRPSAAPDVQAQNKAVMRMLTAAQQCPAKRKKGRR